MKQNINIAWYLPRPKPDHYPGGMPLHCEGWLIDEAKSILRNPAPKILQLFAGMGKYGLRVDLKKEVIPDLIADAHYLPLNSQFDIVIADPPYSKDESKEIYGTPKPKYRKWTKEADRLLGPGGIMIVYHKILMPNPNKKKYKCVRRVFIGTRANHRPRVALFFRKLENHTLWD
ncbi:MAG: hypothetical protein K940chlam7_02009 [Chlamydiae bacterium]|nr:hypothetical protein [Chlamydiota bacterium]